MDSVAVLLRTFMLLAVTVLARIVENANKIRSGRRRQFIRHNVQVLYSVANLQVSLCTGSLGLLWAFELSRGADPIANGTKPMLVSAYGVAVFILLMIGSVSRGVVSVNRPQRIGLRDWDWFFGIVLPNGCGLSSLALVVISNL
jgi:hypothetical protein